LALFVRTVEDCAIVFNAIKGTDGKDLSTIDASFSFNGNRKDLKGIRIAYLKKDFDRNYPTKAQDSLSLVTLRKYAFPFSNFSASFWNISSSSFRCFKSGCERVDKAFCIGTKSLEWHYYRG
ncbi:hypothetical protein BWI92_26800, partial [Flectobacillus sp. BAB-3569]